MARFVTKSNYRLLTLFLFRFLRVTSFFVPKIFAQKTSKLINRFEILFFISLFFHLDIFGVVEMYIFLYLIFFGNNRFLLSKFLVIDLDFVYVFGWTFRYN